MIQGLNKLKNYRLWWLSKPLRLVKFESFWIQACAIVAVSGISGDVSYFLWVFWQRLSQTILLFFSIAFSLFYSVILESRGINDSLVLLPGYQSLFWAHCPEGWAFPCFSFFFPLILFLRKPMANFSILECACFFMSPSLWFNFWPSSLFVIFPEWAESNFTGSKVFAATSFFIAPCSSSPRYCSFALWEVTLGFLLFLARSPVPMKDVSALCFLCFLAFSFELS